MPTGLALLVVAILAGVASAVIAGLIDYLFRSFHGHGGVAAH